MKKININIVYLFLIIGMTCFSQDNEQNWVKTTAYKQATTTSINNPTAAQATVQVSYFDGLGRPIQVINQAQSHGGNNIVQHIEYDALGRQIKEYLPYVKQTTNLDFITPTNALSGVHAYYNTATYENTPNPYSEKEFEKSPLNRILKQAAPGATWALNNGEDHEIKFEYGTNKINEVLLFTFNTTSLNGGNYYDQNELYKTTTRDENATAIENSYAIEYKNKLGQVVLKRVRASIQARTSDNTQNFDTYYVYDNFGNLSYVLPPLVDTSQSIITSTVLDGLCYQYKYDYRKRLVAKKIPGKRWEYIVYDKLDRVRATGPSKSPFSDVNLEDKDGWLITKYDAFDRPILTAWKEENAIDDNKRIAFENSINSDLTNLSESKLATSNDTNTVNGVSYGYSNTSQPTVNYHILTVNYFDGYHYPNPPTIPATVLSQNVRNGSTAVYNGLKTLPTGSWVRILEESTDVTANLSYTLFHANRLGSAIKTVVNYPNGGYTKTEVLYDDFEGKVLQTITEHRKNTTIATVTSIENFSYTAQGRLITNTHKIDTDPVENIVTNEYNELGVLTTKNVGQTAMSPLQRVDYTYNIRGWLTEINDINNLSDTVDDLFAFKINYNIPEDANTTSLFNGNISETYWRTSADNMVRKYKYEYDGLNRLLEANYRNNDLSIDDTYNEHLSYDKNGNILSLERNGGFEANTAYMIDNLVYNYDPNSLNQLKKVVDLTNSSQGFNDDATGTEASDTSDDYDYDTDGNMIHDENKNITLIKYNHLNLPTEIQFTNNRKINYIYDASGIKLKKEVNDGTYITITDYLDGYQYEEKHTSLGGRGYSHLLFFPHTEGYVKPVFSQDKDNVLPKYQYVYNHTDHLGNVRVSYTKVDGVTKVLEENNYYSFGLKHQNYNAVKKKLTLKASNNEKQIIQTNINSYFYKYNGKELQEEFGLDLYSMDMRSYDSAIGRWTSIDPVVHHSMSPYNAFDNNPVFWADPSGADAEIDYNWETSEYRSGSFQAAMANQGLNSDGSEKSECEDPPCNDNSIGNFIIRFFEGTGGFFRMKSSDYEDNLSDKQIDMIEKVQKIAEDRQMAIATESLTYVKGSLEIGSSVLPTGPGGVLALANLLKSGLGYIIKSITKKGITKVDLLLANRGQAMNWARNKLGHNTTKMYDKSGKLIGWKNNVGDNVYWGHGDWGKGVGSSTFPHLNYKVGKTKGHLFLYDKIKNRGMVKDFINYFGL